MAKVTIDAYRTAGRPFRLAIEENATIGAQVGTNLTLTSAVTLLSGQVLPAGYLLQPVDLLNGLIQTTANEQGTPSDWSQITGIPINSFSSDTSNGVVIQDASVSFGPGGLSASFVTADVWASPALTGNPTAPTATAGDNDTSIATTAFVGAAVPNASYRTLMQASSIITAGSAIGTYAMVAGGDGCVLSGANTATPVQSIYIDSADYPTTNGAATKLRIRVQLYTNDTAPTGNYTFGLYPITRPATSGGSGVNIYTIGSVVAGSNGATFTAPAADGLLSAVGADFSLPSNGHYVIGVLTTAIPAANSNIQFNASLQMRNA